MELNDIFEKGVDAANKAANKVQVFANRTDNVLSGKRAYNKFDKGVQDFINGNNGRTFLQVEYDNLFDDEKRLVDSWSKVQKFNYQRFENTRPQKLSKRILDYLTEYVKELTDDDYIIIYSSPEEQKDLEKYFDIKNLRADPFENMTKEETCAVLLFELKRKCNTSGISKTFNEFFETEKDEFRDLDRAFGSLTDNERIWVIQNENTSFANRLSNGTSIETEKHYTQIFNSIKEKLHESSISSELKEYLILKKEKIVEKLLTIDAEKKYGEVDFEATNRENEVLLWGTVLNSLENDKEFEHKDYKEEVCDNLKSAIHFCIEKNKDFKVPDFSCTTAFIYSIKGLLKALTDFDDFDFEKKLSCANQAKTIFAKLDEEGKVYDKELKTDFHDACIKSFVSSLSYANLKPQWGFASLILFFKEFKKYSAEKKKRPVNKWLKDLKGALPEFYEEIGKKVKRENKAVRKSFTADFILSLIMFLLAVAVIILIAYFVKNTTPPSDKEYVRSAVEREELAEKASEKIRQKYSGEAVEEVELPKDQQLKLKDVKIPASKFTFGKGLSGKIEMGEGNFVVSVNPNTYNVIYTFNVKCVQPVLIVYGDLYIGDLVFKHFAMGSSDYEKDTTMGDVCDSFMEQIKSMKKGENKTITLVIENPDIWNLFDAKGRDVKERKAFANKYRNIKNKTIEIK